MLVDKTGKLRGCDHGVCFHQDNKLRTVLWQFAGEHFNSEEFGFLNKVKELDLDSVFADLLTNAEISALDQRVSDLEAAGKFPFPNDQWPAIPWPPV